MRIKSVNKSAHSEGIVSENDISLGSGPLIPMRIYEISIND